MKRRDFLKAVGIGAAATVIQAEAGATPGTKPLAAEQPVDLPPFQPTIKMQDLHVGLFGRENNETREVTGEEYQRQKIEFRPTHQGGMENANEIKFPPHAGDWTTITEVGIFTNGELVYTAPLSMAAELDDGFSLAFQPGNINITLD